MARFVDWEYIFQAFHQDVSYDRACIDHQTRINLDLSIGDIIEIEGTKTTAASVWRAHLSELLNGTLEVFQSGDHI